MTAHDFSRLHEDEAVELLRGRFGTLVRSGYDLDDALVLAVHVEVEVADAVVLLRRGCPSATAVRILT